MHFIIGFIATDDNDVDDNRRRQSMDGSLVSTNNISLYFCTRKRLLYPSCLILQLLYFTTTEWAKKPQYSFHFGELYRNCNNKSQTDRQFNWTTNLSQEVKQQQQQKEKKYCKCSPRTNSYYYTPKSPFTCWLSFRKEGDHHPSNPCNLLLVRNLISSCKRYFFAQQLYDFFLCCCFFGTFILQTYSPPLKTPSS